jgi:hypothetical protein
VLCPEALHRVGYSNAADTDRVAARADVRALALFHAPAATWVAPAISWPKLAITRPAWRYSGDRMTLTVSSMVHRP